MQKEKTQIPAPSRKEKKRKDVYYFKFSSENLSIDLGLLVTRKSTIDCFIPLATKKVFVNTYAALLQKSYA